MPNQISNVEKYRLQCECRQWMRMIREKGEPWWVEMKETLRKKRGPDGLKTLLDAMEQERRRMRESSL